MIRRTGIALLALVASLVFHQELSGQTWEELEGETLLVTVRGADEEVRGRLLDLRGDTLVLSEAGSQRQVAISAGSIVEIQRRVLERKHWTGFGLGAGLVGAGVMIYAAAGDCPYAEAFCIVYYGGMGALGGGLAGLVIGATIQSEEWIDVPVELEAGATPGGGAGLVLSVPVGI